jgi:urease accessory protein UreE
MSILKITASDWEVLKIKLSRKYNHLTDDDLVYTPGEEDVLVTRLAKRLRRDKEYITFTLAKELSNLESNRL